MSNSKPLVIAMVGLPRSGKSTIVKDLKIDYQAPVISKDAIRLALHGQRYWAPAEPQVRGFADLMLRSLVLTGEGVIIVDETNFSRAARNALKSSDWRTLFLEVDTSPEVCKARALATGQPDLLPVIDEMASRYEPLGEDEERFPW